ncbi:hypothetical protein Tco_1193798 [Tanacetum coccineum]
MPFMEEGGSALKISSLKSFVILEGPLSQEDIMAQLTEMKRLADLKDEKEKSEEYLKADQLPITKISYRVNSSKEATMRITRANDPLNVTVYDKFRLKTLGFSEWLEVHSLASKSKGKSNDLILQSLRAKFEWVISQVEKLGVLPPPELSTFRISADNKKRKQTSYLIKEVFFKENVEVVRMHRNLIPPLGVEGRRGLVIRELEAGIFFYNGNFDLVFQREEEFHLATTAQLIRVMKGFSECKASESNIRRIKVKDIIKKVKDYLKTYSSAGIDISCWLYKFTCKLDTLSSLLVQMFIRNNPRILKKWNPDVNLLKEDVGNVPIWVKLHGVPMTSFCKDGLSVIATKLGTSLILDSYTFDICIQSWGRSSYARALIEVQADVELKDNIMDECPKNIDSDVVKSMRKPSQATRGVPVVPKVGFKLVKQVNDVDLGTNGRASNMASKKTNSSGSSFWNVESSSTSTTPIVEKIDKIKRLIIDGKVTLVDDKGKPLAKVDSSGDHDSEDEVASVDNEMTNFLASKKVGYGTNSLLEQWKETYENDDYNFDPYDDDMYEGQDIPNKI